LIGILTDFFSEKTLYHMTKARLTGLFGIWKNIGNYRAGYVPETGVYQVLRLFNDILLNQLIVFLHCS